VTAALLLVPTATFVAWFAYRARAGAGAREAAGIRLRWIDRFVRARPSLERGALGALIGIVAGGWVAAVAGAAVGLSWERIVAMRAARGRTRALEAQVPELLRALASALRAGRSLPQAVEAARDETAEPLRAALDAALRRMDVGGSLDEALTTLRRVAASEAVADAAETIRIGRAAGSNLPAVLEAAVEAMEDRTRIARDRRAMAAQARMSAAVIAAMPAAFFLIAGSGARRHVRLLLTEPVGWLLLTGGLGLEAAGWFWMRRLMR